MNVQISSEPARARLTYLIVVGKRSFLTRATFSQGAGT